MTVAAVIKRKTRKTDKHHKKREKKKEKERESKTETKKEDKLPATDRNINDLIH